MHIVLASVQSAAERKRGGRGRCDCRMGKGGGMSMLLYRRSECVRQVLGRAVRAGQAGYVMLTALGGLQRVVENDADLVHLALGTTVGVREHVHAGRERVDEQLQAAGAKGRVVLGSAWVVGPWPSPHSPPSWAGSSSIITPRPRQQDQASMSFLPPSLLLPPLPSSLHFHLHPTAVAFSSEANSPHAYSPNRPQTPQPSCPCTRA